MSSKIFVGGLPKLCDEQVLSAYFTNFGQVTDTEVKRDANGGSRGFAFVTFSNPGGVQAALACYDQHCIGGKWVEVKRADESLNKGGGAGSAGGAKGKGTGTDPWSAWNDPAWAAWASWGGMDPWTAAAWGWGGKSMKGGMKGGGKDASKGKGKGGSAGKGGKPSKIHEKDDNKLFVGGLPKDTTEEDLKAYFGNFGAIKHIEIKTDPHTFQSRGFGFVTFEDQEAALSCADMYDSHELNGKWIEVKAATMSGTPAPGQKGGGNVPGGAIESDKVFIGGLPKDCKESTVSEWASQFGQVESVDLKKDEASGKPKGFGFITFTDSEAVVQMLATYDTNTIDGKWVDVKAAKKQNSGGGGKGAGKQGGGGKGMGAGYGAMMSAGGHGSRYAPY